MLIFPLLMRRLYKIEVDSVCILVRVVVVAYCAWTCTCPADVLASLTRSSRLRPRVGFSLFNEYISENAPAHGCSDFASAVKHYDIRLCMSFSPARPRRRKSDIILSFLAQFVACVAEQAVTQFAQ